MKFIILNSTNIVSNSNNTKLLYTFPSGQDLTGHQLALASVSMYNSTFNITVLNRNNLFKYIWVDGVEYDVKFDDGNYGVPDISSYMQFVMEQNGHYLICNKTKLNVYFVSFALNTALYGVQTNCFPMNLSLYPLNNTDDGYTQPQYATWSVPPETESKIPILNILAGSQYLFNDIIGYVSGYYPKFENDTEPETQTQTFISTTAPQISPLSSYLMRCSLIQNDFGTPNDLLYSFPPTGVFGSQFTLSPNQLVFIDCKGGGKQNDLTIEFTNQMNLPTAIQDGNMVILLAIRDYREKTGLKV